MPIRFLAAAAVLAAATLSAPRPAEAIPVFAHRYGLTCQACHTTVPHLTPFGETFLANGYRIRGLTPKPAFPVALRVELAYSSAASSDEGGGGLPKAIVDEVELLTGGPVGSRGSYWAEVYAVDGGFPGRARDIWGAWRATPDGARTPVTLRAGQFTLPLPVDPETFRETTDHYAIWDQSAGDNPFTFFETKIGGQIAFGDPARAIGGSVSLLKGHESGSGLPAHGLDTMVALQRQLGDYTLTAYRYDGSRQLRGVGFQGTQTFDYADRFWRDGFGLSWNRGRTRVDAVYQTGNDSAADAYGDVLQTSGGFVQVRQDLGSRLFAIGRWDATQDAVFGRALTAGAGYRVSRNTRFSLFDTVRRDETGRVTHTASSSLLFAL
ncbi:MAG: hypothetical protein QOJ39_219 [Candidatus Eremiobacteraeota bacterium]|nr:hypothetical protein [Candidatus Eremiobacteraeota bacterium]